MYKYKKILVIDDLSIDRLIVERIIRGMNFSEAVVGFESAKDALIYLQDLDENTGYPDLILLDIAMPIMNGFDFLDAFQVMPQPLKDSCKVVMLTSSLSTADYERVNSYDIVKGFLVKPFSKSMLATLENL